MNAHPDDLTSICDWLHAWEQYIADVDVDGARVLFHEDVVGFGTKENLVVGLDELLLKQWAPTWQTIKDYGFDLDALRTIVSPDRLTSVAIVTWHSTGFDENGAPFERPGRATIALERAAVTAPWRCLHTHMTLKHGVPRFSQRPARRQVVTPA